MSSAPLSGAGAPTRRPRAITPMLVARKVLASLLTLFFVVVVNFFLFRILPGDPAKAFLPRGRNADKETLKLMRERMGLDENLLVQFGKYLGDTFRGNLNYSYGQRAEVSALILDRLWPTVLMSGTALVLAVVVGLWLGARTGWRAGSRFDRYASGAAVTFYSTPEWLLGLILLVLLSSAGIFPAGGMVDPRSTLPRWLDILWHLTLPVLVLAVVYIAEYSLIMRSSILDERRTDYLTTARAKGLRDDQVLRRHAVPNALLPSTALFFLSMGFVVSGAITVETVFSWPGLGRLTFDAIRGPDLPLLQGLFLVFSAAVIFMNLIADLLMPVLDPRLRKS